MRKENWYAIYKGDKFLFQGTKKECSEYLGVEEKTVYFYTTPISKKKQRRVQQ
jgi:hypothetical protein